MRSGVKGKVLGLKWSAGSQIETGKVARESGEFWGMMACDDLVVLDTQKHHGA